MADQDDAGGGTGGGWGAAGLGAGMAAGEIGAANLYTELQTLKTFQLRVDALLKDLTDSEAAPVRMAGNRLSADHLGTGFAEAAGLHKVYTKVHEELETLSKLLSGQIEVMSMAVGHSHNGYEEIDLDSRRRMWQIHQQTKDHYDPRRDPDPNLPKQGAEQAAAPKQPAAGDDSGDF